MAPVDNINIQRLKDAISNRVKTNQQIEAKPEQLMAPEQIAPPFMHGTIRCMKDFPRLHNDVQSFFIARDTTPTASELMNSSL